jgi:hypothetical protein
MILGLVGALPELDETLKRLVDQRYGTMKALSAALGVTDSAFSRGVKNGTVGTALLLRLAAVTGEPPSEILRRGGKGDLVPLIEQLYGPPRTPMRADLFEIVQRLERLPLSFVGTTLGMLRQASELAASGIDGPPPGGGAGAVRKRHRRGNRQRST